MSRNKKRAKQQKQGQNFPWLLVALGGVLMVMASFFFARQDGGTPSIAVDEKTIDYGDVKFDVPKTFAIKVTNTGDGTLRFEEEPYIQVLEGC